MREVFDAIRKSDIDFDQCIAEFGRWVHIGFGPKMRKEVMAYDGRSYRSVV